MDNKDNAPETEINGWEREIIRDTETAKRKGSIGGKKSGEAKRRKKQAREVIQYILECMMKSKNAKKALSDFGIEENEYSNMAFLQMQMIQKAMKGDLDAYELIMRLGGYDSAEERKERESINADRRKDIETDFKISTLNSRGVDGAEMAINLNDEEGNSDVVIYLPEIEDEKKLEVTTTEELSTPE